MDTKSVSDDAPTSLGMILEDNDASIGGVYVKEITPNSPAGGAEGLMEGAQIVSISGKSVKGANFESVMEILKASESPVDVQFYDVGLSTEVVAKCLSTMHFARETLWRPASCNMSPCRCCCKLHIMIAQNINSHTFEHLAPGARQALLWVA
jgi:hypothetical protein